MAQTERRTLEINAKAKDQLSSVWRRIGKGILGTTTGIVKGVLGIGKAVLSVRGVLVGFFAYLGVRRVFGSLTDAAEGLDRIAKSSARLNVTAESLQRLEYAADLSGLKFEDVTIAITAYSRALDAARKGTGDQYRALRELGISLDELPIVDGRIDILAVLAEFADKIGTIEDPARRTAIMLQLFGDSGAKLGPLLAGGSEQVRRYADEFDRLVGVVGPEELKRAEDFEDALSRISAAFTGLGRSVFLSVADRFTAFFEALARTIGENREEAAEFARLLVAVVVKGVLLVTQALFNLLRLLERVAQWLAKFLPDSFGEFSFGLSSMEVTVHSLTQQMYRLEDALELEPDSEPLKQQIAVLRSQIDTAKVLALAFGEAQGLAADANLDLASSFGKLSEAFRRNYEDQLFRGGSQPQGRQPGGWMFDSGDQGGGNEDPERQDFSRVSQSLDELVGKWTDFVGAVAQGATQLGDSVLDGLGGAFADIITGTKSAREAFRDYGLQILRTIAEILPRLLIIKALEGITGLKLADGGVTKGVSATFPVRKYADGGVARSPQIAIFGEAGEEAFVPLRRGRIPVEVRGSGATVIYSPQIQAIDAASVRTMLYRERDSLVAIVARGISRSSTARDAIR